MSLEAVQILLTRYLRDPGFRTRYRTGERAQMEQEIGLEEADRALLSGIDLDTLDKSAAGFREERMGKRAAEFKEFFGHLAVFGPTADFFIEYDRTYPEGLLTRPLEMDRFLDFSTAFVLRHGLPEYLLDLLRFCYHYCKLADSPIVPGAAARESVEPRGIMPSHRLELKRPWKTVDFRFDVLYLARSEPGSELAQTQPRCTSLFIQKDWKLAKQTQIMYAWELPLLSMMRDGPFLAADILAQVSAQELENAVEHLNWLSQRGVLNVLA